VKITPYVGLADLVPEKGFYHLLRQLTPSWYSFKTAKVIHAFRLWGPKAIFPSGFFTQLFSDRVFTGAELAGYLLDHRLYNKISPGEDPLLIRTPYGVRVRISQTEIQGQFSGPLGHTDDLLRACGEVGLTTEYPIYTSDGKATLGDLIGDSIAQFDINHELEWTSEALARYLAPQSFWTNRFNECFSFDDIALSLLKRAPGQGTCLGTHVPHALTCLYRISERHPFLSDYVSDRIVSYLKEVSLMVAASRQGDGWWAGRWAPATAAFDRTRETEEFTSLISTGHHLEWIALAPPDCRPPESIIRSAIHGILKLVSRFTAYEICQCYLPLTHLACALCLLKNKTPSDILQAWKTTRVHAGNK